MNKERDLLERWVMQNNFAEYYALREETVTFLAQPEQDNIQYLLDQVSRLTAENTMLKEKWLSKYDDEDEYINEESGYNRSDWWE